MSSRICVKNLPKYVAEDRLTEFFSQKGEVTDAKLMRTKDGRSRQFGFVGFKTEHEADQAIKYFNKSFMDTCKIICEIALKVGDPNMLRACSRHSLKKKETSSEEEKRFTSSRVFNPVLPRGKSSESNENDEHGDPRFPEFRKVVRSSSKFWANDTLVAPSSQQSRVTVGIKSPMATTNEQKLDGDVSDSGSSESEGSVDITDNSDCNDADLSSDAQKKSEHDPVEVMHEPDVSKGEAENGSLGVYGINGSTDPSSSLKTKIEEVLESARLFIHNLPYTATEEELKDHFSKHGTISQVHIIVNKDTGCSMGYGFILFALPECAARALEKMDGSTFQGRILHVTPAKQRHLHMRESNNANKLPSKTFMQQRIAEKKASEATGNTRAWNSLFMRPDTVVENIARRFGVSKSELLDRESDGLAVRIALGETQVIAETKKALSSVGVNISSLEEFASGKADGLERSNRVILVKNLPYASSESELSNMFGKFGSLDKIILPPTKTMALVIFLEPAEACAAFDGLGYKRYKDVPLYLEWAPGNILSQAATVGDSKVVGELHVRRALLEQQVEDTTDADVEPDRIESRSLYVKNLNFITSDESVKKHFSEHMEEGKILSVRVKKGVKNGKKVSMGFGFIEFDSVASAANVCRALQGTVVDGHALILQLCLAKKDEVSPKKVENGRSSTKLIVRNIPFEATKKDIRQLFSPFGQVKSLRLPMRLDKHKGYAFVEYVTKQEAQNALEALSNTHLYGRRLVLERAKEGESLDELRSRVSAQFMDSADLSKKRKHGMVIDEGNVKFERIVE